MTMARRLGKWTRDDLGCEARRQSGTGGYKPEKEKKKVRYGGKAKKKRKHVSYTRPHTGHVQTKQSGETT